MGTPLEAYVYIYIYIYICIYYVATWSLWVVFGFRDDGLGVRVSGVYRV